MQINLELYRVFYIAAKNGSLTKAASELYISQPAVSQSIKQLEKLIGGKLFIRTNKGMDLTYEGRIIFEYIKQANILIDMAEKKFSQLKQLAFGEINIGASDTIIKYYLIKLIKQFHLKYPKISLKITNRTSLETVQLLKTGKVDIGFINLPCDDSYIEQTECIKVTDCFVCNNSFLKNINAPLSHEELAKQPLILLEKMTVSRKIFDDYMKENNVIVNPSMELGSVDLIIEFAKIGMGIGLVTKDYIKEELASGQLVEVPITFSIPKRAIGMINMKGIPLNFAAGQFADIVIKNKKLS
jgi:DNA-binding transcriptional LysR family regulator